MTVKKPSRATGNSSSEDSADGDPCVTPPSRQVYHRSLSGQDTEARLREGERGAKHKRKNKRPQRPAAPSAPQASAPPRQRQSADVSGYNSSDEREAREVKNRKEDEDRFEELLLKDRGFRISRTGEDGACLFRAVADQVYGDQEMHDNVRQQCMDYLEKNEDFFSVYITEDFRSYVARKRKPDCFGNNVEIQALSEMYNRTIEVYQYSSVPINTFQTANPNQFAPIRLSYHWDIHYNSVIDPNNPTVGLGLGFSNFEPGLADRRLLEDAYLRSEQDQLEEQVLRDQLKLSDWEATAQELEHHVIHKSAMEWFHGRSQKAQPEVRRKRRRISPPHSDVEGADEHTSGRYSPAKRSSPTNTQSLQMMQKQQIMRMRMRKENLELAGRTTTAGASSVSSSSPSSVSTAGGRVAMSSSRALSSSPKSVYRQSPPRGIFARQSPPRGAGNRQSPPRGSGARRSPPRPGDRQSPKVRRSPPRPTPAGRLPSPTTLSPINTGAAIGLSACSSSPPSPPCVSTDVSDNALMAVAAAVASSSPSSCATVVTSTSSLPLPSSSSKTVASPVMSSSSPPLSSSTPQAAAGYGHGDALVAAEIAAAQLLYAGGAGAGDPDDVVLAAVMAQSGQEYYDGLKQQRRTAAGGGGSGAGRS